MGGVSAIAGGAGESAGGVHLLGSDDRDQPKRRQDRVPDRGVCLVELLGGILERGCGRTLQRHYGDASAPDDVHVVEALRGVAAGLHAEPHRGDRPEEQDDHGRCLANHPASPCAFSRPLS